MSAPVHAGIPPGSLHPPRKHPPGDGCHCGRYASYWNAFLFNLCWYPNPAKVHILLSVSHIRGLYPPGISFETSRSLRRRHVYRKCIAGFIYKTWREFPTLIYEVILPCVVFAGPISFAVPATYFLPAILHFYAFTFYLFSFTFSLLKSNWARQNITLLKQTAVDKYSSNQSKLG